MATSKVTPDRDAIVAEIHIAAPPERVFRALVDPQQVLKWWGQQGVYRSTEFQSDLRPGGKWRTAGVNAEGRNFEASGEYLEIDPPRLLVYSWVASWTGDAKTTVRWELHPDKKGTLVRLRHYGLAAYPELAKSYSGWPRMLGWLQAFLEGGETVDVANPLKQTDVWARAGHPGCGEESQPDAPEDAGQALLSADRRHSSPASRVVDGLANPLLHPHSFGYLRSWQLV